MAKPAPKTALRKAPAAVHPVAPPATAPAPARDDPQDPFLPGFDPAPSSVNDAASALGSTSTVEPATESAAAPAAESAAVAGVMFSVRMDPTLRRRIKQYVAGTDSTLQAQTAIAWTEYLERHGG